MTEQRIKSLQIITEIMKNNNIGISEIQDYEQRTSVIRKIIDMTNQIVRNARWYQEDLISEGSNLPSCLFVENERYKLSVHSGSSISEMSIDLEDKESGSHIWQDKPIEFGLADVKTESLMLLTSSGLFQRLDKLVYKEAMYAIAEIKSSELEASESETLESVVEEER